MAPRLVELDLPAVPESAPEARRAVLAALEGVAVDRDAVATMVSEAVANTAMHAYPDRAPGRVRVSAQLAGDALDVVVSDDGVGMAEGSDTPGLGIGVPLMGDVADDVAVEAGSGTRITARFDLMGPAGPHGRKAFGVRARLRLARRLRRSR
jgi:anti-sigma regulatory factor (Ser/Thr protein kinase)